MFNNKKNILFSYHEVKVNMIDGNIKALTGIYDHNTHQIFHRNNWLKRKISNVTLSQPTDLTLMK